jgi:hypothetical protein
MHFPLIFLLRNRGLTHIGLTLFVATPFGIISTLFMGVEP